LIADVPLLYEITNATWRKEDELKDLKTELAAIDRKIQLSLQPIEQNDDDDPKNEVQEDYKIAHLNTPNTRNGAEHPHVPHGVNVPAVANVSAIANVPIVPQTDPTKAIDMIQGMFSGKISPSDFYNASLPNRLENERLQRAKETMNDQTILATIPKYNIENQPKKIKL